MKINYDFYESKYMLKYWKYFLPRSESLESVNAT